MYKLYQHQSSDLDITPDLSPTQEIYFTNYISYFVVQSFYRMCVLVTYRIHLFLVISSDEKEKVFTEVVGYLLIAELFSQQFVQLPVRQHLMDTQHLP